MPSKDTKVISLRVPNRVDFGDISLSKLITDIYDLYSCGAIKIEDNALVLPDDGLKKDDFFDVCHHRNIDPQKALDRYVSMLWR